MANELDSRYAAILAQDAYRLKDEITRRIVLAEHKDKLEVAEELKGKTGALIVIKSEHVMGIGAFGIKTYKGHAFVMLKGTASLLDGLTDLNAGVKRCSTGENVHQGFFYTFESFLPQLKTFQAEIAKRSDIHTVHCVGHSLGGALATMAANWLSANGNTDVKLYTFGSPRVGMEYFADNFTDRMNAENIFRVYHKTDPVPMVPTWPFTHVPNAGTDYLMPSSLSLNPIEFHKMENYLKSVTESNGAQAIGWPILKSKRPPELMESAIESWLKSDGLISLTLNTAHLLDAALMWTLKKIAHAASIAIVGAGTITFTVLDRLAIILHKAIDLSKDLSFWVIRLIKRMAQMIGLVVRETETLTAAFIRMIFTRVHQRVSELVRKAGQMLG